MSIIVVDCGHGGREDERRSTARGLVGPTGLLEKDVTARLGARLIEHLGPSARLTRSGDHNLSLAERAELARRAGADVFISLHASDVGRGADTWIHPRAGHESRALAASIHRELERFGGGGRGVLAGELAVLTPERLGARTAACLIEVDNLADPDGERRLRDPRALDEIARAIARGVRGPRYGQDGDAVETTQPINIGDRTGRIPILRCGATGTVMFHVGAGATGMATLYLDTDVPQDCDQPCVLVRLFDQGGAAQGESRRLCFTPDQRGHASASTSWPVWGPGVYRVDVAFDRCSGCRTLTFDTLVRFSATSSTAQQYDDASPQPMSGGLANLNFGPNGPDNRPAGRPIVPSAVNRTGVIDIGWIDYNAGGTDTGSYCDLVEVLDSSGTVAARSIVQCNSVRAGDNTIRTELVQASALQPGRYRVRVTLNSGSAPVPESDRRDNVMTSDTVEVSV
jgi:hypothetical protein